VVSDDAAVLEVDGAAPLATAPVKEVGALCDRVEDAGGTGVVIVHVSGAPGAGRVAGLGVAQVSKWERALRRLERLPAPVVAVARGDVGGIALDALLTADFRVAAPGTRLLVPVDGDATWPGMTLFRLARRDLGAVRRAALLGVPIETADARALGLLDEIAENTVEAVAALASAASGLAGTELAIRRRLLADAASMTFDDALGQHLAACERALRRTAEQAAS
jgi:isomerase DpgB